MVIVCHKSRSGNALESIMKKSELEELHRIRWEHMGRWLNVAFRHYEETVIELMNERGFTDLRLVHFSLTRCLDEKGTRLTDIAERAGMHKQAVGQLVKECEQTGYVERRSDPEDGRAQLICFTKRGDQLIQAMGDIHKRAEAEFREIIGDEDMEPFKRALKKVASARNRANEEAGTAPKKLSPNGVRRSRGRPPKKQAKSASSA